MNSFRSRPATPRYLPADERASPRDSPADEPAWRVPFFGIWDVGRTRSQRPRACLSCVQGSGAARPTRAKKIGDLAATSRRRPGNAASADSDFFFRDTGLAKTGASRRWPRVARPPPPEKNRFGDRARGPAPPIGMTTLSGHSCLRGSASADACGDRRTACGAAVVDALTRIGQLMVAMSCWGPRVAFAARCGVGWRRLAVADACRCGSCHKRVQREVCWRTLAGDAHFACLNWLLGCVVANFLCRAYSGGTRRTRGERRSSRRRDPPWNCARRRRAAARGTRMRGAPRVPTSTARHASARHAGQ